jgi:hypothetical protein
MRQIGLYVRRRLLRCGQIAVDDSGDPGQRSLDFEEFAFGMIKGMQSLAGKAKAIASPYQGSFAALRIMEHR